MQNAAAGTPDDAPATRPPRPQTTWQLFYLCIVESLESWPVVQPIPDFEDHGDPTVRAMQRARRFTWLYARHGLGWSMFESIRISVRLADAFADWTRGEELDLYELARQLERVESESREQASASVELRFVDQLMSTASVTDLPLAEMDLALEAFRRSDPPDRRAIAGG